jgi:hypothetical protein
MHHQDESPFHAVGYALMSFVEALLSFESEKIQMAAERINAAELLARQYAKKAKKRNWYPPLDESNVASLSFEDNNNDTRRKRVRTADIQYELIATHCILMASTLQFLRNSWLDYMKAAYKLRKAYRLYEQMFESLTGQKTSEYASVLRSLRRPSLSDLGILAAAPPPSPTLNEKRASMFHPRTTSFDSLVTTLKQRPASILDNMACDSLASIENSIESSIFFGIGLFSLIFSLLPPRGK